MINTVPNTGLAYTPTVGGFNIDANTELRSNLTALSEYFANKTLDAVSDIKSILLSGPLSESYKTMLLEDYHSVQNEEPLLEQLHQLNAVKLEQLVENSCQEILNEAGSAALNPIVGLTPQLLKITWIENIMKDFIQTEVAPVSVINRQIERQFIKDAEGKKHYIPDIFETFASTENVLAVADKKLTNEAIPVPSTNFDLLTKSHGSIRQRDEISRNFRVVEVTIITKPETSSGSGDEETKTIAVNFKPEVSTNTFSEVVVAQSTEGKEVIDTLFCTLDYETGMLTLASTGKIKSVKVDGTLSSENNMTSASVGWETINKQFVISVGRHLNTGLTKERMQAEQVYYNVNKQAKAITDMTGVLNHLKDSDSYKYLNESKARIINDKRLYLKTSFDCKPYGQYAHTPVEYRSIQLKETLDKVAIKLKKILKTPNCFFAILGNPEDTHLLGDVNWSYSEGKSVVGSCRINHSFGLLNADHTFLVLSSTKVEPGKLRVIVRPTTDEHISYIHLDHAFIISNDYRDPNMPNVPSVMVSNSYLDDEIIPIQAEIEILNNKLDAAQMQ